MHLGVSGTHNMKSIGYVLIFLYLLTQKEESKHIKKMDRIPETPIFVFSLTF